MTLISCGILWVNRRYRHFRRSRLLKKVCNILSLSISIPHSINHISTENNRIKLHQLLIYSTTDLTSSRNNIISNLYFRWTWNMYESVESEIFYGLFWFSIKCLLRNCVIFHQNYTRKGRRKKYLCEFFVMVWRNKYISVRKLKKENRENTWNVGKNIFMRFFGGFIVILLLQGSIFEAKTDKFCIKFEK